MFIVKWAVGFWKRYIRSAWKKNSLGAAYLYPKAIVKRFVL